MWIFKVQQVLQRGRGERCTEIAAGKTGGAAPHDCPLSEGNWPVGGAA
jgi:hypothetical protein